MLSKLELMLDGADAAGLAGFLGSPETTRPAAAQDQAEDLAHRFEIAGDDDGMRVACLHDPRGIKPSLCLLEVPEPKTVKNRLHVDLVVSGDGPPEEQWRRVTDEVAGRTRPVCPCSASSSDTAS